MDDLKNFVDNFREEFENEPLPENHKERFLIKRQLVKNKRVVVNRTRQYMFYMAAASVALFLILTPTLYFSKVYNDRRMDVSDYTVIMEERSETVTKIAAGLNPQDKAMVLSTLDQLTFEAVPFDSQIPDGIVNGERKAIIKSYYTPKIEGVDKLEQYARQLKNR